jgi:hypothetical protein
MDTMAINWSKFRYEVFDAPTHPGIYRERYAFLGIIAAF